jgi:co-chaperonin GroES (HSP10)
MGSGTMIKAPEDIIIIKVEKKTEPETTASGLILAASPFDEPKNIGVAFAVGEGRQLKSGVRVLMDVKVGDKIMFNPNNVMKFKHDGDDYLSLYSASVLAILGDEEG